jgi:membrane protein DedA with SNARE-associated domain
MLAADLQHAPACATTLIVALGLLAAPLEGVVILLAVGVLVAVDRLGRRVQSSLARGVSA